MARKYIATFWISLWSKPQVVPVNSGYWWCSTLKNLSEIYLKGFYLEDGMQVNGGDWWYIEIQQLIQIARNEGIEVVNEHLRNRLKRLCEIYLQEEEMEVNPGEWWSKRIKLLTENWIGYWWYSRLKGLPKSYSREAPMTVNARDWLSSKIQQLLEISVIQRMHVNSGFAWFCDVESLLRTYLKKKRWPNKAVDWWCRNIEKLIQPFVVKGAQMEVNPGLWWCRQIQLLIENWRGYWWYSRLKRLPDSYYREAQVNAGDWYCRTIQELLQTTDMKGMQIYYDYWWHNKVQRLLATYLQGMQIYYDYWWLYKVQRPFATYLQGMQIYYDYWWHNKVQRPFATYLQVAQMQINASDWWCSEIKQLIESFVVKEMLVNIGDSWNEVLQEQFKQKYFIKVKVVIFGQDPYYNPDKAHGLCFSVQKGVKTPPSLNKIFKELEREYECCGGFKRPDHGSLEGWAEQGVLLLNMCLTVREEEPGSHQHEGWEDLTKAIVDWLVTYRSNIVFMLWGDDAQNIKDYIYNDPSLCKRKKEHHILTAAHPAYFGRLVDLKPFKGCGHFIECNDYLGKNCITSIDWSYLP